MKLLTRLGTGALVLFAMLSCSRRSAVSSLPQPTGEYRVGSVRFSFVDLTRPETFTPDTTDFREVAFRMWYPALKTSCTKRVPYIEKVVGHSFGGAAAGEACLVDSRCRCGVNLDGLELGGLLDRPLKRPFMFVHHDNEGAANKLVNLPFFETAQDTCCMAMVRGTRHLSFSDVSLPVFARITGLPAEALGPINGLRALTVTNDLVRSFFDRHLRGLSAPLLDDPAQEYPEIELRTRGPGA